MNERQCPACGRAICDFVVYCPYCAFGVRDYWEQQQAEQTAAYFADILPVRTASEEAPAEDAVPVQRPGPKRKMVIWLTAGGVLTALVLIGLLFLSMTRTAEGALFHAPTVTERVQRSPYDYDHTLVSQETAPHAVIYSGMMDEGACCVYMEDGKGQYTGYSMGKEVGYCEVDPDIRMKSISTTYQYYVLGDDYQIVLVNFDIVFNEQENGIFMYDLFFNNNTHSYGRSVAVRNGKTRIEVPVTELEMPEIMALEGRLEPKGFIRFPADTDTMSERLWGGDVQFRQVEPYESAYEFDTSDKYLAECAAAYTLPEACEDPAHTLLLYAYHLESGGNSFEYDQSTYYITPAGRSVTKDTSRTMILPHQQVFYGSPVQKPTYRFDFIGWLTVKPFAAASG